MNNNTTHTHRYTQSPTKIYLMGLTNRKLDSAVDVNVEGIDCAMKEEDSTTDGFRLPAAPASATEIPVETSFKSTTTTGAVEHFVDNNALREGTDFTVMISDAGPAAAAAADDEKVAVTLFESNNGSAEDADDDFTSTASTDAASFNK